MIGNTDNPIVKYEEDQFKVHPYVEGLVDFIKECETPMSIAIQGVPGCGKSSMMLMVRNTLEREGSSILPVWFNAWQYSQFDMGDQLAYTFLLNMADALSNGTATLPSLDRNDPLFISKIKSTLEKLIESATRGGDRRVVIFIDDLDSLPPKRTIELLESLKIFISSAHTVCVLAVDPTIVYQGVKQKYGEDTTEEAAQDYYDKIIQLPFKMPVASYDLDPMVKKLILLVAGESPSESDKKEITDIIVNNTQGNPRSIKRLTNAFLLLDKMSDRKNVYEGHTDEERVRLRIQLLNMACGQFDSEIPKVAAKKSAEKPVNKPQQPVQAPVRQEPEVEFVDISEDTQTIDSEDFIEEVVEEVIEEPEDNTPGGYATKIRNNKGFDVYTKFAEQHVYPRFDANCLGEDPRIAQEQKTLMKPEQFELFNMLGQSLRHCVRKDVPESTGANSEHHFSYTLNECDFIDVDFDSKYRTLKVSFDVNLTCAGTYFFCPKYTNLLRQTIGQLQDIYQRLADEYGARIFQEKYAGNVEVQTNDVGGFRQYNRCEVYLYNDEMVELVNKLISDAHTQNLIKAF